MSILSIKIGQVCVSQFFTIFFFYEKQGFSPKFLYFIALDFSTFGFDCLGITLSVILKIKFAILLRFCKSYSKLT